MRVGVWQDDEVGFGDGLGLKNLIGLMNERCFIEKYCNIFIFRGFLDTIISRDVYDTIRMVYHAVPARLVATPPRWY